ncbi:MAG: hypothetical protein AM325_007880 [Candidatus Thorarchaeota archaeon SMTZ1-45]
MKQDSPAFKQQKHLLMLTLQLEGEEMTLAEIEGTPRVWNTTKTIVSTKAVARVYFRR